jgi:shikimate kinase
MRGVGRAHGAVTFLNALFTGEGAAAAIDRHVTATVEFDRVPRGAEESLRIPAGSDSPLVRAAVADALTRFGDGMPVSGRVVIDSKIPPARGLKSSSAVGVAIARAVGSAYGHSPDPESLARASADVTQEIGLSATGAFDDALASAEGGVVLTENAHRTVRARGSLDPQWSLVLWIPAEHHAPSPGWADRFRAERHSARRAVESAERGDWLAALTANTELVERVMRYDYRSLRATLVRLGALASGVTGLGPTLATIVARDRVSSVVEAHPAGTSQVQVAQFVPPLPPTAASR